MQNLPEENQPRIDVDTDHPLTTALLQRTTEGDLASALLDTFPAHIALVAPDGTIVAVNAAWNRFARDNGAPFLADSSVGMNYLTVCAKAASSGVEEASAAYAGIRAVLDGARSLFTLEYPCHAPTERRWFLLYVRSLPAPYGGAMLAHIDITERKLSEDAIREVQRDLAQQVREMEAVIDAMPDSVLVFREDGRIERTNSADRELVGYDATEAGVPWGVQERGHHLDLRDTNGHPLPKEQWPSQRVLCGDVFQGDDALEFTARSATGQEITLSATGRPIHDESGHISGGVLVTRNVTRIRNLDLQTRKALETLISTADLLVSAGAEREEATPGANQLIRRLAELTRNLLGCERVSITELEPETLRLRPMVRVGWPLEEEYRWYAEAPRFYLRDFMSADLIDRLQAGEVVINDVRAAASMGLWVPGVKHVLVAPMRVGERLLGLIGLDYGVRAHQYRSDERMLAGTIAHLSALLFELRRLLRERETARANELASHEVARRMELFIAMASHEIRAPLTIIKGYTRRAEHLLSTLPSDVEYPAPLAQAVASAREALEEAQRATGRATGLLDDLAQISSARAGKLSMHVQPADMIEMVSRVVKEQRHALASRRLRLHLGSREHIPVVADPERITQVLLNYLSNADKYSPVEQPIDVSVRVKDHTVRVSVHDRGNGVSATEQQFIWDQFYQSSTAHSLNSGPPGLGMGLYVCRVIIEQHAGEVGMRSAPGKGSTFWFSIPMGSPRD